MFRSVRSRIIATFAAIAVLSIAIASIVAFQAMQIQERVVTGSMGIEAVQICATTLQMAIDDFDTFKPGTKEYENCRNVLRTICKNEGMSYLYAYILDLKAGTMTYLIVAAADDRQDDFITHERPYGTVVDAEADKSELEALAGNRTTEPIEYDNQFGHMLDWVALVDKDRHLLAAASYSFSEQHARVIMSTTKTVAAFIGILFLLLVIQLIILQRHVMKPLNIIVERMMSFSAENARSFEPIGISSHDELEKISRAFDDVVAEIGIYLEDIEKMTEAKVQTDVALSVASRIQQGMVPATKSVSGVAANVFAFSRPAREVGGDFYEIVELEDGSLSIIIGDVSGKGIGAALFMAMSKEMIRIELTTGKGPAETLRSVNEQLCMRNPEGLFVTAFIATLSPDGSVVFANAGHLPPVRVAENATPVECLSGCLLGLFDDADIEDEHLELAPGETLLLYTDGASEAVNAKREFLGNETIVKTLSNHAPFNNAQDVLGELVGAVDGFAAQTEQFDDLTVIAMMRHCDAEGASTVGEETPSKSLDVSLSSFDEVRRDIMNGTERSARLNACLACEEAFVNIVSYSGAHTIFYDVSEKEGRLIVVLEDDGMPFDPLMAQPIEKDFEDLDSGGMGIALVKSIADELSYRRSGGRNILTMKFDLS